MRSKNSARNGGENEKGCTESLSAAAEEERGKQKQGYSFWSNLKVYKTNRIWKINMKSERKALIAQIVISSYHHFIINLYV